MAYKGKYFPKNVKKYEGDPHNIVYRSLWERQVFRWCDLNPDVEKWGSETVIIAYNCATDGKMHRYFPDLKIKFSNGTTLLIEIKPDKQTRMPKKHGNKQTRKFLKESLKYMKNESKWKAAIEYAEDRDWKFQIWTEKTLKNLGITITKKK